MVTIKKYNYDETQISSILVDESSSNFLWISFLINAGTCLLKKVNCYNPLQTYYDIDVVADKIVKLFNDTTYLYVAIEYSTILGYRYLKSNPLSTSITYTKPISIIENPIDILTDSTYVYFLIPGIGSGNNTKIAQFTLGGTFVQIIDLLLVTDATSFYIDTNGDIWVVTYTDPTQLIRVYDIGSNVWNFTITQII